jgi:uncharacterized membrane protein YdjX (TVP38/TMEM64 family)
MTSSTLQHDLPVHRGQAWRRAGILALLCIALAVLASSDALHTALIQLLSTIEEIIAAKPILGATLFIAFAALSAMFAFVSVAAVVPVVVYTWGPLFSIALLWIGWIVGGVLAYCVGRFLGRPVVMWLASNNEVLHKVESRVGRNTPFGVVLLFQLGLPSEIPGYVLGLARYSLPRYLLSLGLAELPYTIATVLLGQSFVERRTNVLLAIGAALICLSIGTFYLLRRALGDHKHG